MKLQLQSEFSDCRDCPLKYDHRGHGECWSACSHPKAPQGYGNILWGCQEEFTALPSWCPVLAESIQLTNKNSVQGGKMRFNGKHLAKSSFALDEHGYPILDENGDPRPSKTAKDMEQLQAFLGCMDLKFKVRIVHNEPCGPPFSGGKPQVRVKGRIEGQGIKGGEFEITFAGQAIEVQLEGKRQELFLEALTKLDQPKLTSSNSDD